MKNKSTLVMTEYVVMLLVFILAATICMRMFGASETLSQRYEAMDRAVAVAQNTAEELKNSGYAELFTKENGTEAGVRTRTVFYDKAWKVTEEETAEFVSQVTCEVADGFLMRAEIVISTAEGTELFRLPVAAQAEAEVAADETN